MIQKKNCNEKFKKWNKEKQIHLVQLMERQKELQVNVWRNIIASKRKDLIGALSVENLKVLKMMPFSTQIKDLCDQIKGPKN